MKRPGRLAAALLLALAVWLAPSGAYADPNQTVRDGGQPVSGARSPGGAVGPPVAVTVTETVTVTDAAAALPPLVITITESVGVADKPGGAPPPKPGTPAKTP